MKYIFRGNVVLDYNPEFKQFNRTEYGLDYCKLINEDYTLLAEYFDIILQHSQGKEVELKDIEVW